MKQNKYYLFHTSLISGNKQKRQSKFGMMYHQTYNTRPLLIIYQYKQHWESQHNTYRPLSQKCRVDLIRPFLHFFWCSFSVGICYHPKELQTWCDAIKIMFFLGIIINISHGRNLNIPKRLTKKHLQITYQTTWITVWYKVMEKHCQMS